MKKRLISLFLSMTLALSLIPEVFAADPYAMVDIAGHWAEESIQWTMEYGLFNGTSETEFSPQVPMTRSMFVTVLGRMAGVDPEEYQDWYLSGLYSDVDSEAFYAPYVNWATRNGITNGVGDGMFGPDMIVNREMVATLLIRFASIYNYNLTCISDQIVEYFDDCDTVADYAQQAVDAMRITGILNGKPTDFGTYCFDPKAEASRAECAAIFHRFYLSMAYNEEREMVAPEGIDINTNEVCLTLGETTDLGATVYPEVADNQTVTWVSSNPEVVKVTANGQITALQEGIVDVYCYTWNGHHQICSVISEREVSLAYDGETYEEKCDRIFGEFSPRYEYRDYYENREEAQSHMVTIKIKAWDFTDSTRTEKYTREFWLTVHENIADTVQAIFDEIYNGEEQFPIHSIGGYRWDYGSEHTIGCAIDINANENYYYNYRTGQQVGSHWKPYEDPYSIPTDGEVARIMNKYGFSQGIWSSSVDYMHFSYFGW